MIAAIAGLSLVFGSVGFASATQGSASSSAMVLEVLLDGRDELDQLVATGVDLDHKLDVSDSGELVAYAVVDAEEAQALEALGFDTGAVTMRAEDTQAILAAQEAAQATQQEEAAAALAELQEQAEPLATDAVVIMRADWFTTGETGHTIYIEARTSAGDDPSVDLDMCWDTGPGTEIDSGGCEDMGRFSDAGQYLYHRDSNSWDETPPHMVRVTSSEGGVAYAEATEWLPTEESPRNDPYVSDFITGYMNPTELYEAYDALAEEYPDLVERIDLPYLTNGYRRHAQANLWGEGEDPVDSVSGGSSARNRTVVVESHAWGHEGGNDLSVELLDPGAADSPLGVSVSGNLISVSLGTDAGGALVSTAADVIAALNAHPGSSALLRAYTYRGEDGDNIVEPQSATPLWDQLEAPPEISREPWQVRAYRLGKDTGKDKMGVLAYAQEHAREWVPPLVVLETTNRLLANYDGDGATKQLLNTLDIFVIPSLNPDGGHFSFFDQNFQRKNLFNHCDDPDREPSRYDDWGVDNNRNYDYGSDFDGYDGASGNCRGSTYHGPAELSEPESHNLTWFADNHPQIRFSMNLHSSGNYFMWSPGAYSLPGRVTLPRPSVGDEAFFWAASGRILSEIKTYRNLAVTSQRTGPICDVLYSAAGNSGDRLWYVNEFYAWNFEVGTSFQPNWTEAHAETMEFSNGLMELFRVAYDYGKDHQRPKTSLEVLDSGDGWTEIGFDRSEPATIFYTLDGSRPTFSSDQIQSAGIRLLDETLTLTEDTDVSWF
jgi:uncharacterized protein YbjQ (UPF0145 family)